MKKLKTYFYLHLVIETTHKLKPGDVFALTAKGLKSRYFQVRGVGVNNRLELRGLGHCSLNAQLYDHWSGPRPTDTYRAEGIVFSLPNSRTDRIVHLGKVPQHCSDAVRAGHERGRFRIVEALDPETGEATLTVVKRLLNLKGEGLLTYALEDLH